MYTTILCGSMFTDLWLREYFLREWRFDINRRAFSIDEILEDANAAVYMATICGRLKAVIGLLDFDVAVPVEVYTRIAALNHGGSMRLLSKQI